MKLSPSGLELIKELEGLSLKSYRDSAGLWTIGYGHLLKGYIGEISIAEARSLLTGDLLVPEHVLAGIKLNQNQYDAMVSFVYNIGVGAFIKSTIYKRILIHDYQGAAEEFPKWKYAGGKLVQGLVNRRKKERELFERPIEEAGRDTLAERSSLSIAQPGGGRDAAGSPESDRGESKDG